MPSPSLTQELCECADRRNNLNGQENTSGKSWMNPENGMKTVK